MPHFGHMDEGKMTRQDAELMRARLHLRAARRRFLQGRIGTGVSVLFDAFISSIRWYALSPGLSLDLNPGDDPNDERALFYALVRSGILDGRPDYDGFNAVMEDAVEGRLKDLDYTEMLRDVEYAMTRLGVMPFDLRGLPPEAPDAP